jgi:AcrR family transcriptional regulator
MPRVAGQIDQAKNGAILDAASEVLFERGLSAPIDEIARRAGVSKQTIYNHYGSKAGLVGALIARRINLITEPLAGPTAEAFPEAALAAYGRAVLTVAVAERSVAMLRLVIESVPAAGELGRATHEGGVRASLVRLAAFLEHETHLGRMGVKDAIQGADFFFGMVTSHHQMSRLLGAPTELDEARIDAIAREAAHRFMRAYAP